MNRIVEVSMREGRMVKEGTTDEIVSSHSDGGSEVDSAQETPRKVRWGWCRRRWIKIVSEVVCLKVNCSTSCRGTGVVERMRVFYRVVVCIGVLLPGDELESTSPVSFTCLWRWKTTTKAFQGVCRVAKG